jgi:CHASE3 domain sensor protein
MRLARLPLLAALLASAVTASFAGAQEKNQKAPKVQTPSRAGQVAADDIIDRMTRAERAVLERLRASPPFLEV